MVDGVKKYCEASFVNPTCAPHTPPTPPSDCTPGTEQPHPGCTPEPYALDPSHSLNYCRWNCRPERCATGTAFADGRIDARDAVFPSLRLWQDANHDGVSQSAELHTLPALDVARLHLDYKESKRTDMHGNQFRYRAKVDDAKGTKVNRWAWDVFLVAGQ